MRYKLRGDIMTYGKCDSNSCCSSNRHFITKDEKIEMLKEYKEQLDKESKGVTERIKDLEKN